MPNPPAELPERPANEWMERAVLGHLLMENEAWADVLVEDDFSLASHRTIFLAIHAALSNGEPIDTRLLDERLTVAKELDAVGGRSYLFRLTEGLVRQMPLGRYIAVLKEKAKLRRILAVCDDAMTACYDQTLTAAEIVATMGKGLKGIRK